jgi:hypothetical protein
MWGHDVPLEQFEPAYDKILAESAAANPKLRIVLGEPTIGSTGTPKFRSGSKWWQSSPSNILPRWFAINAFSMKFAAAHRPSIGSGMPYIPRIPANN